METFCEALFELSQGKSYAIIVLSLFLALLGVAAMVAVFSGKSNPLIPLVVVALSALLLVVVLLGC